MNFNLKEVTLHNGLKVVVGSRIKHDKHGLGTVVSLGAYDPNQIYTIDIKFDNDGRIASLWRADTMLTLEESV